MSERDAGKGPSAGAEPGFTSLYSGDGARGWEQAGPGAFREDGGTLVAEGGMGLYWYAAREYGDFTLRLDWLTTKLDDNSGVFVRFPDPGDDPWVAVERGYEIQIHDSSSGQRATGAIYNVKAPVAAASLPPGQWNSYEIGVEGRGYTVVLNGVVVNTFTSTDERRGLSGYIGIQNHDDDSPVRFRNIRVREP